MAFTRAFEEHEVTPELRRLYGDVQSGFDQPFVPTIFKLLPVVPSYLKLMWKDLNNVACSREFQAATQAFQEIAHSAAEHHNLRIEYGYEIADKKRQVLLCFLACSFCGERC